MKYSELFYTIQGEGILVGVPSVFFRTSYCNLRCIWCDTPYTSREPENKYISVNEAMEEITKYNCKHICKGLAYNFTFNVKGIYITFKTGMRAIGLLVLFTVFTEPIFFTWTSRWASSQTSNIFSL